jgi:hypothetical protein
MFYGLLCAVWMKMAVSVWCVVGMNYRVAHALLVAFPPRRYLSGLREATRISNLLDPPLPTPNGAVPAMSAELTTTAGDDSAGSTNGATVDGDAMQLSMPNGANAALVAPVTQS